jgi:hypothetical protein
VRDPTFHFDADQDPDPIPDLTPSLHMLKILRKFFSLHGFIFHVSIIGVLIFNSLYSTVHCMYWNFLEGFTTLYVLQFSGKALLLLKL